MLLAFPEENLVAAVWIGRHSRDEDAYQDLCDALGLDRERGSGRGQREKPPCCEEHGPPIVDEATWQLLEEILR